MFIIKVTAKITYMEICVKLSEIDKLNVIYFI